MTPKQIFMLIKVQAVIRGKLTRNKLKNHPKYKNLFSDHSQVPEGEKKYYNAKVEEIR